MIDVILACFQINSELTKQQCNQIGKATVVEVRQEQGIELNLKRTIYKRKMWSTNYVDQYKTLYQLDTFFKSRDYDSYDLHLGIMSNGYLSSGFSAFFGQKVCVSGTAGITANGKFFRSYKKHFVARLKHEIYHLLGGIHKDGIDFDKTILKQQILNCLKEKNYDNSRP